MRALLIIPGYKGSALKAQTDDGSGRALWLPFSTLFKNERLLDLPIDNQKEPVVINPAGVLKGMPPFIDVYGPLIKKLVSLQTKSLSVFCFSYDWRRSTLHTVCQLYAFINELRSRGYSEFNFVCHSLGGTVLAYYLRYGNQNPFAIKHQWQQCHDVRNAVFCAVPFRGTMRALQYMLVGNPLFLNRTILDARCALSFPVAYEMMPNYTSSALTTLGHDVAIDLFSRSAWQEYNLGLYGYEEYFATAAVSRYLSTVLPMSQQLLTLVDNPPYMQNAPDSLRILNLRSDAYPTLRQGLLRKTAGRPQLIFRKSDLKKIGNNGVNQMIGQGDGLVCQESGVHPFGGVCTHLNDQTLDFTHKNLFAKERVRSVISDFVVS